GSIDLDLITKGEDYKELQKSFVIFICTFDPFDKGRHLYTFENRCKEDYSLILGDETTKLFLNTQGILDDVDTEMIEFLTYIEESTDAIANAAKSQLVKEINQKVKHIKEDKSMEVEYMTLLERDREKFQEGIEQGIEKGKLEAAKALLDILDDETISSKIGLSLEKVKSLRTK
ncbi:MAG: Rpn family recombination-promoting nuclease/putative transposase, partial [Niameybacter sp.]